MSEHRCTVVELSAFARAARSIWDEAEIAALVDHLSLNPRAGDLIPDTGGFRKLRWGRSGMGKRGGARVIYYFYTPDFPVFLHQVYAKADRSDLTSAEKEAARAFAAAFKALARS
jgi:hypothetical protein